MATPVPTSRGPRAAAESRQREGSTPSARSLLLTVLGEFVQPRDGRVWTGTLVDALGTLGIEEKSSRQALARTAAEGLLTSTRHGRKVLWTLTPSGAELLREGAARIYGFMRKSHAWDGDWLVLTAGIPEAQRQLRHRLRTRLTWLGLGSPTPGLWIIPDASKASVVAAVVRELGLEDRVFAWSGPSVGVGHTGKLLAAAWDLDDVEKRYLAFIQRFEAMEVRTPEEAFASQVHLIQEWRRFPFLDPDLPAELLQHDWPGPRAAATFHSQHDRWHRRAQDEWDRMDAAAGARN